MCCWNSFWTKPRQHIKTIFSIAKMAFILIFSLNSTFSPCIHIRHYFLLDVNIVILPYENDYKTFLVIKSQSTFVSAADTISHCEWRADWLSIDSQWSHSTYYNVRSPRLICSCELLFMCVHAFSNLCYSLTHLWKPSVHFFKNCCPISVIVSCAWIKTKKKVCWLIVGESILENGTYSQLKSLNLIIKMLEKDKFNQNESC